MLYVFFFSFTDLKSTSEKKVLNLEMNRHHGEGVRVEIKGSTPARGRSCDLWAGKLSDTHKLRAICCKLQVLSARFWFSLDGETWTNCFVLGQKKILGLFLIFLSGCAAYFCFFLYQILTRQTSSPWTISQLHAFLSSKRPILNVSKIICGALFRWTRCVMMLL